MVHLLSCVWDQSKQCQASSIRSTTEWVLQWRGWSTDTNHHWCSIGPQSHHAEMVQRHCRGVPFIGPSTCHTLISVCMKIRKICTINSFRTMVVTKTCDTKLYVLEYICKQAMLNINCCSSKLYQHFAGRTFYTSIDLKEILSYSRF